MKYQSPLTARSGNIRHKTTERRRLLKVKKLNKPDDRSSYQHMFPRCFKSTYQQAPCADNGMETIEYMKTITSSFEVPTFELLRI